MRSSPRCAYSVPAEEVVESSVYHTPVMANEVLSALVTTPDGLYVDCTLGGGGHAEGILQRLQGVGRLIGFDRDGEAIAAAGERLRGFGGSFQAIHAPFGEIETRLAAIGIGQVHGIFLDLGVSSHHLDDAGRGFSFQEDGPLDMRMDRRTGKSAADVVNTYSEQDLMTVLVNFGEEREAPRIAKGIVQKRPLTRTADLADIVRGIVKGPQTTKSLARVFQAIRIEVNNELHQLHTVLHAVPSLLRTGGRIVVLTYHSLEDRIVKDFFRSHSRERDTSMSRFLPDRPLTPVLRLVNRKPVLATDSEASRNPRARSAKLRAAERI